MCICSSSRLHHGQWIGNGVVTTIGKGDRHGILHTGFIAGQSEIETTTIFLDDSCADTRVVGSLVDCLFDLAQGLTADIHVKRLGADGQRHGVTGTTDRRGITICKRRGAHLVGLSQSLNDDVVTAGGGIIASIGSKDSLIRAVRTEETYA